MSSTRRSQAAYERRYDARLTGVIALSPTGRALDQALRSRSWRPNRTLRFSQRGSKGSTRACYDHLATESLSIGPYVSYRAARFRR